MPLSIGRWNMTTYLPRLWRYREILPLAIWVLDEVTAKRDELAKLPHADTSEYKHCLKQK